MLLVAPWLTSAGTAADAWLIRRLLGPAPARRAGTRTAGQPGPRDGRLGHPDAPAGTEPARRRADPAGHAGDEPRHGTGEARRRRRAARPRRGPRAGRAAHRGAKDALAELRDLARGIHPPVLDNGLADALATLAAEQRDPGRGDGRPARTGPTPAIETIAYFCAAELLANAAKHSRANATSASSRPDGRRCALTVADDGAGGARTRPGGRADRAGPQRVAVVDGGMRRRTARPAARPGSRSSCRRTRERSDGMRVVIAEDAAMMREGWSGCSPTVATRCARRGRRRRAAGRGRRHQPDVAVVDIRMPPTYTDEGLRAAHRDPRAHPGTGVLVFSQYVETRYTARLLADDAGGRWLPAQGAGGRRRPSSWTRWSGWRRAARRWTRRWSASCCGPGSRDRRGGVATAREREVLSLMAEGRSNTGIAAALVVTAGRWRSTWRTSSPSWACPRPRPTTAGSWPSCATSVADVRRRQRDTSDVRRRARPPRDAAAARRTGEAAPARRRVA